MLTQREDVVKHMTFDVDTPVYTIFNDIKELGYISTTGINT